MYCRIPILTLFILLLLAGCNDKPDTAVPPAEKPSSGRDTVMVQPENRIRKTGSPTFDSLIAVYESPDRINWQKPSMVISLMGGLEGKTIADIGAGTGYFTFRFLPLADRVIAIDIDPRMIRFMEESRELVPVEYRDLLEIRMAEPDDPRLQAGEADVIFLANTYTYLEDRVNYFRNIHRLLPEDGTLVIIDFKKKRTPVGPTQEDKVPLYILEQEMQKAGFHDFISNDQALPYQYIFMARKRAGQKG